MKPTFPESAFFIRTRAAHLSAVLHRAKGRQLVILCHGFTGNKAEYGRLFLQMARALQKIGINALRFDFMGSGDSSGEFQQMTPNTQIRDALDVLNWSQRRYDKIGLLGMSFGGATAICASHQARKKPDALLTWSAVPSLRWWNAQSPSIAEEAHKHPLTPGLRFWKDRPKIDVPEAYVALKIPRFQIQGDADIPEFRERFAAYCPQNDPLVRHLVIPGADHVFVTGKHRQIVIAESVRWLKKQLGSS